MLLKVGAVLLAGTALSGCGGHATPVAVGDHAAVDWRSIATTPDRNRLRTARDAWTAALAKARASGKGGDVAAQGALFDPDAALPDAALSAGRYRCRVFKLGAQRATMADFTAYPVFECSVEPRGTVLGLYKVSGSQRPVGLLFPDGPARSIFLGTLMLGDETTPLYYGRDAGRDMIGILERVGEKRWRLALPYPRFESTLDVVELVPAD